MVVVVVVVVVVGRMSSVNVNLPVIVTAGLAAFLCQLTVPPT